MTVQRTRRFIGTAVTVLALFLGSTALAGAATGQSTQPLAVAGQAAPADSIAVARPDGPPADSPSVPATSVTAGSASATSPTGVLAVTRTSSTTPD